MENLSIVPYVILTVMLIYFGKIILEKNRFYYSLSTQSSSRYSTLDGLRGFLALGVFFNHAPLTFYFIKTGKWDVTPNFYILLGEVAVNLFFMVTAFLFCDKIIRSNGKLDIKHFFANRIKRLFPMSFVSSSLVFLTVFYITGWHLQVPLSQISMEILHWFSCGILNISGINGFFQTSAIECVYWTLKFEWLFYISLPFVALFVPYKRIFILSFIMSFIVGAYTHKYIIVDFSLGALAAISLQNKWFSHLKNIKFTFIPLLLLVFVFSSFDTSNHLLCKMCLFVFFLFIVHGNSLFGLLTHPAAKCLGIMSYSIYLLHNILLFNTWNFINSFISLHSFNLWMFWLVVGIVGIILVTLSTFTYQYIEHYFYNTNPSSVPAYTKNLLVAER